MKNADKPISPCELPHTGEYRKGQTYPHYGLTKREYFAGIAMNGWLACHFSSDSDGYTLSDKEKIAEWSIGMADELLKQLEKE